MDDKSQVSYLHKPNTQYQCMDCPFWLSPNRCVLHGEGDDIIDVDSCNYFVKGTPGSLGFRPLGLLTKEESGWARNEVGFTCKRCEHFDASWDCSEVDKMSKGDDPGMINPDACCNEWKKDAVRGNMPTEAFYEITS